METSLNRARYKLEDTNVAKIEQQKQDKVKGEELKEIT